MSETEKIETKAFNIRAKIADHEFVTNFLKDYEPKHVGFTAFCNAVKNNSDDQFKNLVESHNKLDAENEALKLQLQNQPVKEVHQNLNEIFDFTEYGSFALTTDTSIVESIKRALQAANDSLKESGEQTPTKTSVDFVPPALVDKVNLLHRDLRMKNKIPESTQAEYLEQLLTHSLKYFLLNEYPNIYNR